MSQTAKSLAVRPHSAESVPVLAIDGPSASGKGTIARRLANALGFHYLDSGAVYRVVALAALRHGVDLDDEAQLVSLAHRLKPIFRADGAVLLDGEELSEAIRREEIGQGASRVAVHPALRHALFHLQISMCQPPGLVADGRDMGTVVFPGAHLKVFLTASVEERARRRQRQLLNEGIVSDLAVVTDEMEKRDARDKRRAQSPLRRAADAVVVDSTALDERQVLDRILGLWEVRTKR